MPHHLSRLLLVTLNGYFGLIRQWCSVGATPRHVCCPDTVGLCSLFTRDVAFHSRFSPIQRFRRCRGPSNQGLIYGRTSLIQGGGASRSSVLRSCFLVWKVLHVWYLFRPPSIAFCDLMHVLELFLPSFEPSFLYKAFVDMVFDDWVFFVIVWFWGFLFFFVYGILGICSRFFLSN